MTFHLATAEVDSSWNILVFCKKIYGEIAWFNTHFKLCLKPCLNDMKGRLTILPELSIMNPIENLGKVLFHKARPQRSVDSIPSILDFTRLNTALQAIRQFFNKWEEVIGWTDLEEERKKCNCYLSQPIDLNYFIPEGNNEWAAQGNKCTSISVYKDWKSPFILLHRHLEPFRS